MGIRPSKISIDVDHKTLTFDDDQGMANILYTLAPHVDSAYRVGAYEISQRVKRAAWIDLFECTLDRVLMIADLLFITGIESADDKDLKFLRFLISERTSRGKITAIDSEVGLTPHKREEA